jgi:hypothetical protein
MLARTRMRGGAAPPAMKNQENQMDQVPRPPARPRPAGRLALVPPAEQEPWIVDVHVQWDARRSLGTMWGYCWREDDGASLDIPSIQLTGDELGGDVVAMLNGIWTEVAAHSIGGRA